MAVTRGPVQAMVFAVPGGVGSNMGSTQTTITAEEAYLVAGLGPLKAMVAPWSDPQYFYGRPATKGTQISIGANIGVAASKWQLIADATHQIDQSGAVATPIAAQTATGNADKTLGILGVEIYDPARAMVHALAFRAFKQLKSYWPDSTPTTLRQEERARRPLSALVVRGVHRAASDRRRRAQPGRADHHRPARRQRGRHQPALRAARHGHRHRAWCPRAR